MFLLYSRYCCRAGHTKQLLRQSKTVLTINNSSCRLKYILLHAQLGVVEYDAFYFLIVSYEASIKYKNKLISVIIIVIVKCPPTCLVPTLLWSINFGYCYYYYC